ncbi:hypothetical protein GCM10018987_26760 [Streptomyces cremeus]
MRKKMLRSVLVAATTAGLVLGVGAGVSGAVASPEDLGRGAVQMSEPDLGWGLAAGGGNSPSSVKTDLGWG